ncbi:PepSY-associated TM helix domain-containing protein [Hydrogenophaga palleronii]|uniref:PepSY-associated TM helix domain-containing protein n=1 Tax=Hydrogenophaga palleronii TaxID=65655 RepID=UPI0008267DC3|nr:PepSY-associated TM helix domain-containing protein [Hydrogenophaga palleronii]
MKDGFRQCMAWLHTWTGLVVGWVLFFVFLTGTVGYFDEEIGRWMQPERRPPPLTQVAPAVGLATAQALLAAEQPDAARWIIHLPADRDIPHWRIHWPGLKENVRYGQGSRYIEPVTGETIVPQDRAELRRTGGGVALYRMHYALHYMSERTGVLIVGVCTMLMLLAIVSGIVTHKKIFTDFFTFRPGKGQRSWLDAHNLISVTALPFFLMITYSGLVFFMDQYMPAAMVDSYGASKEATARANPLNPRGNSKFDPLFTPDPEYAKPAPGLGVAAPLIDLRVPLQQVQARWGAVGPDRVSIEHPGQQGSRITFTREGATVLGNDRLVFDGSSGQALADPQRQRGTAWNVQDVLINLHEGMFAGWALRWLYFLSGLLGCAMIATGLVLWTVKRRRDQDKRLKAGQSVAFGFRLVEALNIGTIAGLCSAVAVYFWANRLLPADFADRRAWEFHCLFIAWGLLLLHAAVRLRTAPALRVWQEQLWVAALAFGLLPALNGATTDRHLGSSLAQGDWVLAGFDLTTLVFGVLFAVTALRLRRRQANGAQAAARPARTPAAAA